MCSERIFFFFFSCLLSPGIAFSHSHTSSISLLLLAQFSRCTISLHYLNIWSDCEVRLTRKCVMRGKRFRERERERMSADPRVLNQNRTHVIFFADRRRPHGVRDHQRGAEAGGLLHTYESVSLTDPPIPPHLMFSCCTILKLCYFRVPENWRIVCEQGLFALRLCFEIC